LPPDAKTTAEVKAHWEANADAWTLLTRAGFDIYRDAQNTPAFLSLLPPVAGLRGLDVGCGEGHNTRLLAQRGARMEAIDLAERMIAHAQTEEQARPLGIVYRAADAMALPHPAATFDFVTAFMSLMDVPDPPRAIQEAARVLKPGGFLQFSITHPCFAPPTRKVIRENGEFKGVLVSDYFTRCDGRVEVWTFSSQSPDQRTRVRPFTIPRFDRTLSDWVAMVAGAGLHIVRMQEPAATPDEAVRHPMLDDTVKVPLFLHVQARKPA
jgi:ubiquinone/menaquinone biosynthesis C-methylase UbiE